MSFMFQTLARSDDLRLLKWVHVLPPAQTQTVEPEPATIYQFILRDNKTNKVCV